MSHPHSISFRSFAVVPAAGRSTRMGEHKLLLPFGATTVIEQVLSTWQASQVNEVVVVARCDDLQLSEVCQRSGVSLVTPLKAPPQMKDSVRIALEVIQETEAPDEPDVWLLAPADMPRLHPKVIDLLLQSHDPQSPTILVPTMDGRRGHPVLFPWPLARAVGKLGPDSGVNKLLDENPVREIARDEPTILEDLDTPEDYRRLQGD